MLFSVIIFSMVAIVTQAQNTTVSLLVDTFIPLELISPDLLGNLSASIAGSDPTATTFVFTLDSYDPTSVRDEDLLTWVEGPSTVSFSFPLIPSKVIDHVSCRVTGTTSANCNDSLSTSKGFVWSATDGIGDPDFTSSSGSDTLNSSDLTYLPVIITARAGVAPGTGASVTTANGRSTSTFGPGATGTGSSTAGVARITHNAGVLLGGAVAAAGLVYGGL